MLPLFSWIHKGMDIAIRAALRAQRMNEVPVGACLMKKDVVLARAHNCVERWQQPLAHAEILALLQGGKAIRSDKGSQAPWRRLSECWLYVTLEPCPLCWAAIVRYGIEGVVFGAYAKAWTIYEHFDRHTHAVSLSGSAHQTAYIHQEEKGRTKNRDPYIWKAPESTTLHILSESQGKTQPTQSMQEALLKTHKQGNVDGENRDRINQSALWTHMRESQHRRNESQHTLFLDTPHQVSVDVSHSAAYPLCYGGWYEETCSHLLRNFFCKKRESHVTTKQS